MANKPGTGFTLVELLLVISIIALLAMIIVPVYRNLDRSQKRQSCINNLREIGMALEQYRQDYGVYPEASMPAYLDSMGKDADYLPFSQSLPFTDVVFSGDGENDLSIMDNRSILEMESSLQDYHFVVEITKEGPPDEFRWSADGGNTWSAAAGITGQHELASKVTVEFDGDNNHRVGDTWKFSASPIPDNWETWRKLPALSFTKLANDSIQVSNTGRLAPGMHVFLYDDQGNSETAEIATALGTDVTFTTPLSRSYASGGTMDPGYQRVPINQFSDIQVGNFGIAKLYHLYLGDKKDYIRGRNVFHCPSVLESMNVNRSKNVEALNNSEEEALDAGLPPEVAAEFRQFDPLWAGYNTYDITYNYDQYHNEIMAYDAALGYGALNTSRQLNNATPPADTVVTWCFGERLQPTTWYPDPTTPALLLDSSLSDAELKREVTAAEQERRLDHVLVLWVDGSVELMRPYLARGRETAGNKIPYYWVPPFLYSTGDWRQ